MWLVKAAGALSKLPAAATRDDAIKFLTKLGVVPEAGWKKDDKISKEFLLSLLGDKDAENLSFDDLVKKVEERVTTLFNQSILGFFPASSGSGSASSGGTA